MEQDDDDRRRSGPRERLGEQNEAAALLEVHSVPQRPVDPSDALEAQMMEMGLMRSGFVTLHETSETPQSRSPVFGRQPSPVHLLSDERRASSGAELSHTPVKLTRRSVSPVHELVGTTLDASPRSGSSGAMPVAATTALVSDNEAEDESRRLEEEMMQIGLLRSQMNVANDTVEEAFAPAALPPSVTAQKHKKSESGLLEPLQHHHFSQVDAHDVVVIAPPPAPIVVDESELLERQMMELGLARSQMFDVESGAARVGDGGEDIFLLASEQGDASKGSDMGDLGARLSSGVGSALKGSSGREGIDLRQAGAEISIDSGAEAGSAAGAGGGLPEHATVGHVEAASALAHSDPVLPSIVEKVELPGAIKESVLHPPDFGRRPSVLVTSTRELFGEEAAAQAAAVSAEAAAVAEELVDPIKVGRIFVPGDDAECKKARTILLIPFSFWQMDDEESPAQIARALLSRHVRVGSENVSLWERSMLPSDAKEFSLHFRTLLGYDADESAPIQRLRLSDAVRRFLFSEARLWADAKGNQLVGKHCAWEDVQLIIFPHGALLSFTINWIPDSGDHFKFSLSDLRTWLYLAKFRAVKAGVTRGWSFGQLPRLSDENMQRQSESLGLKLFAALYGGAFVSLGSVANWLVKMPLEDASNLQRRISRFQHCLHHTFAQIDRLPRKEKLDEFLFHIRKGQALKKRTIVESSTTSATPGPRKTTGGVDGVRNSQPDISLRNVVGRANLSSGDQVLTLRSNALIGIAQEGVFGVEWNAGSKGTFMNEFMGMFFVLTAHCLSERATLEKLSYLAAIQSQHLPTPGAESKEGKDKVRIRLMALATKLVRYRSSMASDDCGGRSDFREYFRELRSVYDIAGLKTELREELQDTLAIVESDWIEEKRAKKKDELVWKLRREEISKKKAVLVDRQKSIFDIVFAAFTAISLPFLIIANIFSMNNADIPSYVSWYYLMIACGIAAIVLFLGGFLIFRYGHYHISVLNERDRLLTVERMRRADASARVMRKSMDLRGFARHSGDGGAGDDDSDDQMHRFLSDLDKAQDSPAPEPPAAQYIMPSRLESMNDDFLSTNELRMTHARHNQSFFQRLTSGWSRRKAVKAVPPASPPSVASSRRIDREVDWDDRNNIEDQMQQSATLLVPTGAAAPARQNSPPLSRMEPVPEVQEPPPPAAVDDVNQNYLQPGRGFSFDYAAPVLQKHVPVGRKAFFGKNKGAAKAPESVSVVSEQPASPPHARKSSTSEMRDAPSARAAFEVDQPVERYSLDFGDMIPLEINPDYLPEPSKHFSMDIARPNVVPKDKE